MKQKQVKFICDNCGKETEFYDECKEGTKPYRPEHPYKYGVGWVYLHNATIRLWKMTIDFKDKHFCCKECFLEFLKKDIEDRIKKQILDKLK